MNQTVEHTKAINKIRNLRNMSVENGCSEHEAENAMNMIAKLMSVYNIELTDVILDGQSCVEYVYKTGTKKQLFGTVAVAVANFCDSLVHSKSFYDENNNYKETLNFIFFGLQQDIELAEYLMEIIISSYNRALNEFKDSEYYKTYNGHRLSIVNSFRQSFNHQIVIRLKDLKNLMNDEYETAMENSPEFSPEDIKAVRPFDKTGTDIIAVKQNKVENEHQVKYGFKVSYKKNRNFGRYNQGASQAGKSAANNVSLNKPMSQTGSIKLIA